MNHYLKSRSTIPNQNRHFPRVGPEIISHPFLHQYHVYAYRSLCVCASRPNTTTVHSFFPYPQPRQMEKRGVQLLP